MIERNAGKYGGMKQWNEKISTQKLVLTPADTDDLPALEEIEKECDEYFKFDPPSTAEHYRPLRECVIAGDFIPGVSEENYKRENYFLFCVWRDDTLAGFLSYYIEYKQKDTVYLSVVYVKEAYRRSGAGTEILEALTQKFIAEKFKYIRLHCSLRNSTALRFWVRNGFDRVLEVKCNGNLYPGNFGGIELMKKI